MYDDDMGMDTEILARLNEVFETYDRSGMRIDYRTYSYLFTDWSYRQIMRTEFPDGTEVSTVWLGLDHAYGFGKGVEPLIFETMIFSDGNLNHECNRYATELRAIEGHRQMVELVISEGIGDSSEPGPEAEADNRLDLRVHRGG